MSISTKYNSDGKRVTISVSGRITPDNYLEIENELKKLNYTDLDLTMDFRALEYITSAGLRVLLVARKNLPKEKMRIINASVIVKEIFDTTGFSDFISIQTSGEEMFVPENASFKDILKIRAKENPNKQIVFCDDKAYTWKDIDNCSQIIADDLAKMGVHKGSHVAIYSKNSINWIMTFYAIQKLGGILVLLNFALKPGEIITYSQIGDITHLCVGDSTSIDDREQFCKDVKAGDSRIEQIYDMNASIDFRSRYNELDALEGKYSEVYDADDPSIMIFTSGTTGLPKGVLSSSRDKIKNCRIMAREMHTENDDKICLFLPLCHVFGFGTGLSASLLYNIPLFMPSKISDERLLDVIEDYGCTIFNSVPTKILSMVKNPAFSSSRVKTLRCTMIGGAAITEAQLMELREKMPNNHFLPIYGMSEISPISIVGYDDTVEHITKTVGKPVKKIKVEIRNPATGEVCPIGTEGEIVVKSEHSLICYYKLDIEKQAIDKEGWIPTGDLGVIDEDGYLRITGRCKELIIKGGENIAPNEIASVLTEMSDITDVRVLGVADEHYGETIAAALIMKEGASFDKEKVDNFVLSKLSKFKLPSYYVLYEKFPLLSNGKVNMIELKKEIEKKLEV